VLGRVFVVQLRSLLAAHRGARIHRKGEAAFALAVPVVSLVCAGIGVVAPRWLPDLAPGPNRPASPR